jgi:hypothetical protein
MTAFTNIGLYSPKQAERLIGVEAEKIRRWLMPARSSKGPLWEPEPQALGAEDTLSFRDLLELRAVAQFRRHNVSLTVIREALKTLSDYLQRDYPLINPLLSTDGEKVFLKVLEESGETAITDLVKRQNVFHAVISPSGNPTLKTQVSWSIPALPLVSPLCCLATWQPPHWHKRQR